MFVMLDYKSEEEKLDVIGHQMAASSPPFVIVFLFPSDLHCGINMNLKSISD